MLTDDDIKAHVPWLSFEQLIDDEWIEAFCREAGLLRDDLWWLKIADNGGTCTRVFEVFSNPCLLERSRFLLGGFVSRFLDEPSSFFMMRDGERCAEDARDACVKMLRGLAEEGKCWECGE